MWKIIVGFIAFAALAMFVLMKSGGDIDMSGEKHSVEAHPEPAKAAASEAAPAATAAPAPAADASAPAAAAASAPAAEAAPAAPATSQQGK